MKNQKNSNKKLALEKLNITKLNRKAKSMVGGNDRLAGDSNSLDGGNTTVATDLIKTKPTILTYTP